MLKSALLRDTRNADIQTYIGYSYRRLRELELAFAHFRQALTFNPRHRAAHQHMGETYLTIGNVAAAREHLAALEGICLIPCAEHGDLLPRLAQISTSNYQQRGSRAGDVATLLEYRDIEVPARNGCRYVQLSHKEAGRLIQSGLLSTNNADRARRLVMFKKLSEMQRLDHQHPGNKH
ncbi:hypothetical protein J6524_20980 [Bradyrhizobium sp. WSM 1738]|uniref:hypothetical protein n=1 Tax=Bradyrhizobium hereditatis TaxID=2821405 RepID=UPI001CE3166C|nr:hypothetical protein [Bradyrhizobium hereditatis]MCA6117325.1 hypothetical protein [Bradyrhizobium hereditatis]